MYNILARVAYNNGADYFITLNDDIIIKASNWTSKMIQLINNNKLLSNFGTTGFVGINNMNLIQLNFISRIHLEIFALNFYPTVLLVSYSIIVYAKFWN